MASAPPGEDRTTDLLKQRIQRVFRVLPGALAGREESIHQVRIAGRRLRVTLPLVARKAKGGRFGRTLRALRKVTRAAGTGRDLDVLVGLLEDRLGALTEVSRPQRELLGRLRAARTRSRGRMVEDVLDVDLHRLRRDLRAIRSRGPADVFTVLTRAREAREQEGAGLLLGLAEVGERYEPDALHALRRRVRRLRYTAEVEDAMRGQDSGAAAVWKRLQDAIGVLHDTHLLAVWLEDQARRAAARGRDVLAATARAESEAFAAAGRRLHGELLQARPNEIAAHALEAMARGRSAA
jgi:CHAD domain-containing protein